MLKRELIETKMKERGFIVYAYIGTTIIQFVSEHMYDRNYITNISKRNQMPIINIIVNLDKDEFECEPSPPKQTKFAIEGASFL